MPENQKYWDKIVTQANDLRKILNNKPALCKRGFVFSPPGILNAYREGDLSFDEAVQRLEEWHANADKWKAEAEARRVFATAKSIIQTAWKGVENGRTESEPT